MAPCRLRRTLGSAVLAAAVVLAAAHPLPAAAAFAKLSGVLPSGATVVSFQVSPDGRYVVYGLGQAGSSTGAVLALYSVPLAGGAPIPLGSPFTPAVSIYEYRIAPDSNRVVFIPPDSSGQARMLYSVPIAGPWAPAAPLWQPDVQGSVGGFLISPDSLYVVFDDRNHGGLYSVALASPAGAAALLTSHTRRVSGFEITPDGRRVLFTDFNMGYKRLYSVPIEGPGSAVVPLSDEGSVSGFAVSPDSSRTVYAAGWMGVPTRLYSVATAGRDASAATIGGTVVPTGRMGFTPGGSTVIFEGYLGPWGSPIDLYGVTLQEPFLPVRVSAAPDGGRAIADFALAPDGSRVVYRADHETAGLVELFSSPLSWPAMPPIPRKLNGPPVAGGGVLGYQLAPDGALVYLADQRSDGAAELFSLLDPDQVGAIPVNGALAAGGSVAAFRLNPARGRVVYLADQEADGVMELFAAPIVGPIVGGGPWNTKFNGPLAPGGDVLDFALTPDGARVVYLADQERDGIAELYVADYGPFGLGFAGPAAAFAEGAGAVGIAVRLGDASLAPVRVGYAVTGGNASAAHYSLTPGTLSFAPGETLKTIALTIHDDALPQEDRWLTISLIDPEGAYLGYSSAIEVDISADDGPTLAPVSLLYLPLAGR